MDQIRINTKSGLTKITEEKNDNLYLDMEVGIVNSNVQHFKDNDDIIESTNNEYPPLPYLLKYH